MLVSVIYRGGQRSHRVSGFLLRWHRIMKPPSKCSSTLSFILSLAVALYLIKSWWAPIHTPMNILMSMKMTDTRFQPKWKILERRVRQHPVDGILFGSKDRSWLVLAQHVNKTPSVYFSCESFPSVFSHSQFISAATPPLLPNTSSLSVLVSLGLFFLLLFFYILSLFLPHFLNFYLIPFLSLSFSRLSRFYIPHFLSSFLFSTFNFSPYFLSLHIISPIFYISHVATSPQSSFLLSLCLSLSFSLCSADLPFEMALGDTRSTECSSRIPLCHSLLNPALFFLSLPRHTAREM